MDLKTELTKISKATGHAALSPSQLPRILRCPASPRESTYAPIPEQSEYAALGELKHAAIEEVIKEGNLEVLNKYNTLTLADKNDIADAYEYFLEILETFNDTYEILLESQVSLAPFGLDMIYGTTDVIIRDIISGRIVVLDWKFGQGVQVYAEGNEQCLAYAAGAVGYPNNLYKQIEIHIAQPPLNHYDVWIVDKTDINEWVFEVLCPAIDKVWEPEPMYVPGEKQCRFCPAAMQCKARHSAQQSNATAIFKGFAILPQTSKEQLADLLAKSKELKQYIKQIEKYAEDEILRGRPFPGKKAVRGRSTRKWKDEVTAFNWLRKYSDIELGDLYTKKFISPAQVEKLARTLKKDEDFKKLIVKPEGALIVVDSDDKRPAVELEGPAGSVFKMLVSD